MPAIPRQGRRSYLIWAILLAAGTCLAYTVTNLPDDYGDLQRPGTSRLWNHTNKVLLQDLDTTTTLGDNP